MSLETEIRITFAAVGVQDENLVAAVADYIRKKTDQLRQSLQRIAEGAHFSDCPAENDESAPCDCHVGEAKRGLGE